MPPDDIDIANDHAMRDLELRIAEVRARARADGPEQCIDCEEVIPLPRRKLGLFRCVECAQIIEARAKLWAK